jgi:hypothetical protein
MQRLKLYQKAVITAKAMQHLKLNKKAVMTATLTT